MKKFFGFGSNTPPPPPPPAKPPAPPKSTASAAKPAAAPEKPATGSVVGRWQEPDSSDTTEFRADGTVVETVAGGDTIRGRYTLRDGTLRIKLEGVPNELTFPVSISADALQMTDPDGRLVRYKRL